MSETKIGVSGGESGIPVEGYVIPAGARIREVKLTTGWFVDSIQVGYVDAAGAMQTLPGIGGHGDEVHSFTLEDDEYLVGVSGRSAQYLDNIRFHTNKRVSPTYGGEGGAVEYSFLAPEGSEVVGFFGRADWYIDAIGIVVRDLPATAERTSAPVKEATPAKPEKAVAPKAEATAKASAKTPAPAKAKKSNSAAAVESAPAAPAAADDLKIIEGIGPKIADLLAQNGIATFAALAATSAPKLREMLLAAGQRFAVSDPTTWPEQAELAAKGDMDALKAFQAQLKGGRKAK
jgi:predicted flap endonuclease-1-like 5' DNA nuclease